MYKRQELVEAGEIAKPIFHIHEAVAPDTTWRQVVDAWEDDQREKHRDDENPYTLEKILTAGPSNADCFRITYDAWLTKNIGFNAQVLDIAEGEYNRGLPVLILFWRIPQGELLYQGFRAKGLPCELVVGGMSNKKLSEILDRIRGGEQMILVGSGTLNEGIDVPTFGSVVMACGGKGDLGTTQRAGRGMRKKQGLSLIHI